MASFERATPNSALKPPMIPFIDFGGSGPQLHFAHANGYPPGAYRPLLETLTPGYHIYAMCLRPLWAESQASLAGLHDWTPLVDDLIHFFDERGERGMIGAGHSLGALLTLAAALRRPELFRALVLIDPVLFRRRLLFGLDVFRRIGILRQIHPLIPTTLKRRRVFANAAEMFARYRRAAVFRRIDDRGLRAYVESMAKVRADGQVELAYSPEWEVKIYETGPLDLWSQLKTLQPPLLIIRGAHSDAFRPKAARKVQRYVPQATLCSLEGAGHLVPMEKPEEVGQLIKDFLAHHP